MLKIKPTIRSRLAKTSTRLRPAAKKIRTVAIVIVALGCVLVAAAIAYTWYIGLDNREVINNAQKSEQTSPPIRTPRKPSPTAPVGEAIQYLTEKVTRGGEASITIHTNAFVHCKIKVEYNTADTTPKEKRVEEKSTDLKPQMAGEYGMASWSWTVSPSAPLGEGEADVRCANQKNWGRVVGEFVVK